MSRPFNAQGGRRNPNTPRTAKVQREHDAHLEVHLADAPISWKANDADLAKFGYYPTWQREPTVWAEVVVDLEAGTQIGACAEQMVRLSLIVNAPVTGTFNGWKFTVTSVSDPTQVVAYYHAHRGQP